jgi:circadian clock protein KaiC
MKLASRLAINLLPTGVPGLDEILGGGLPKLSFNLVAGTPGTGKTTLAHQFAFANATVERPALIFSVLGETTLKLLRYQQQFEFFDPSAINSRIRIVNIGAEALNDDLSQVLARIAVEVEALRPGVVVIDSLRNVPSPAAVVPMDFDRFAQRLSVHLATWDVTTLMIGELLGSDVHDPVFKVADGVLLLTQDVQRNSVVRKLQVVKMRGAAPMPGLHTFRIDATGVVTFPRIAAVPPGVQRTATPRLSTGLAALDEMMGGGVPSGDVVVVAGPTGSGKTTLTTHFARAGFDAGESVVLVVFEEFPRTYVDRARRLVDLDAMRADERLEIIYLRPLDLSVDETLHEIRAAVKRIGASRVVIDSLSGFEVALAPTFREDFSESLYRLVGAIVPMGVTVMLTVEKVESLATVRFKNDAFSFMTDDIIVQRYVERGGDILRVLGVLKMRGSEHRTELRLYRVAAEGIVIGDVANFQTDASTASDIGAR